MCLHVGIDRIDKTHKELKMISFTAADVGCFPANLAVPHAAREALDITDYFLRPNLAG
jgi:hypothetical protein